MKVFFLLLSDVGRGSSITLYTLVVLDYEPGHKKNSQSPSKDREWKESARTSAAESFHCNRD